MQKFIKFVHKGTFFGEIWQFCAKLNKFSRKCNKSLYLRLRVQVSNVDVILRRCGTQIEEDGGCGLEKFNNFSLFFGCNNNSTIIFALPNGTNSLSTGCRVQEIRSYEVTNMYVNHTCSISQACSSKSYVDASVLQHVFINANLCCLPWYKFHVHKLYRVWEIQLSMHPEPWNIVYFKDSQLQMWWGCHHA